MNTPLSQKIPENISWDNVIKQFFNSVTGERKSSEFYLTWFHRASEFPVWTPKYRTPKLLDIDSGRTLFEKLMREKYSCIDSHFEIFNNLYTNKSVRLWWSGWKLAVESLTELSLLKPTTPQTNSDAGISI